MKRKIGVILLLAVSSGNAAAAWVAVGANDVSYIYVDPATMVKVGDTVKMWHLIDFNAVQVKATGKRYMSEKWQYEYDCKAGRTRILNSLAQSRNMGGGVVVEGDWQRQNLEQVSPNTLVSYLWKYACGKQQ